MTSPVPASWMENEAVLNNPIESIPAGKKIYLAEETLDISSNDERLSSNQGDGAVMIYYTNWDAIHDQTLSKILFRTLVGGYQTGNPPAGSKKPPMKHPYRKGLYCKDIVSVKSVAIDGDNVVNNSQAYQVAQLTLSFESLPYTVSKTASGGAPNPNWLEIGGRATNQRISTPPGWYTFIEGSYTNYPAQFGTFFSMGLEYITVIVHRVRDEMFLSSGSIKPVFAPDFGKVNSETIFGCSPGTLLMDSAEYQPHGDWFDETKFYSVKYNMIYNEKKWNTSLDPGGSWSNIHLPGTGSPGVQPFETTSFKTVFFDPINP